MPSSKYGKERIGIEYRCQNWEGGQWSLLLSIDRNHIHENHERKMLPSSLELIPKYILRFTCFSPKEIPVPWTSANCSWWYIPSFHIKKTWMGTFWIEIWTGNWEEKTWLEVYLPAKINTQSQSQGKIINCTVSKHNTYVHKHTEWSSLLPEKDLELAFHMLEQLSSLRQLGYMDST